MNLIYFYIYSVKLSLTFVPHLHKGQSQEIIKKVKMSARSFARSF